MASCMKCPRVTFEGSGGFVCATRGRVGAGGEWRNFAQLFRKCIVVGNPLEIEIGRGSGLSGRATQADTHMAVLHQSIAEPEKLVVAAGGTVDRGHVRGGWRGHICQNCSVTGENELPKSCAVCLHFLRQLCHSLPSYLPWKMLHSSNHKNVSCEWMWTGREQLEAKFSI